MCCVRFYTCVWCVILFCVARVFLCAGCVCYLCVVFFVCVYFGGYMCVLCECVCMCWY